MNHLRTIRSNRVKKPYIVLPVGKYPDGEEDYWAFSTKEKAFKEAAQLSKAYKENYWVVEVSYKPLLGP